MVWTRPQMEQMSKEKLATELLKKSNIAEQIKSLNEKFDFFTSKYDKVISELAVSKKVNDLLIGKVKTLERNLMQSSQYHRREIIEINPVPMDISDAVLESNVCSALSLSGTDVTEDDLQSCHRMKKTDHVILKFKDRKKRQKVMNNRTLLKNKQEELKKLGFSDKLYLNDSLSVENQVLFYKTRQLKKWKKISDTWFFNNKISVRVHEKGKVTNIFHDSDVEKLLQIDDLDEYLVHM